MQATFTAFKNGGWLAGLIGLGGMVARLLLRPEEGMTLAKAIRHSVAAIVVGNIVWYILLEVEVAGQIKASALALSGLAAPELLDFALKWAKAKAENQLASVKKKGSKGTNGTKKPKRK
jgi:hypothetical protein